MMDPRGSGVKVIINADDFGRTREVNRAVIAAHEQGILSSASLMIAGEASEDAVRLAREHPTLAVGLHVVVVDGPAVLGSGRFPDAPVRLGMRYAFSKAARTHLAAELRAQFERFAQSGLRLSHVDGHQHMHMHPAVFEALVPLAREFGARGIRIVHDDLRLALRFDRSRVAAKVASALVFWALARRCRRRCAQAGLQTVERTYGFFQSGAMTEQYLLQVIDELARSRLQSAEIYFHPTCGPRLDPLGPNPADLESLVSRRVKEAIRRASLRLSTYGEMFQAEPEESGVPVPACHAP